MWGMLLYAVCFLGRALASGGNVCNGEGVGAFLVARLWSSNGHPPAIVVGEGDVYGSEQGSNTGSLVKMPGICR